MPVGHGPVERGLGSTFGEPVLPQKGQLTHVMELAPPEALLTRQPLPLESEALK